MAYAIHTIAASTVTETCKLSGDLFRILLPSADHSIASQKKIHPLIGLYSVTMPLSTSKNNWILFLFYLFMIFLICLYWTLMPVTMVLELCYLNITMIAESMLLHMLVNRLVNLNRTTASLAETACNCQFLLGQKFILRTDHSHMAYYFQKSWRAISSLAGEIVGLLLSHWTQAGSQAWECQFFVPVPCGKWGNCCSSFRFSLHIILIFTRR